MFETIYATSELDTRNVADGVSLIDVPQCFRILSRVVTSEGSGASTPAWRFIAYLRIRSAIIVWLYLHLPALYNLGSSQVPANNGQLPRTRRR